MLATLVPNSPRMQDGLRSLPETPDLYHDIPDHLLTGWVMVATYQEELTLTLPAIQMDSTIANQWSDPGR